MAGEEMRRMEAKRHLDAAARRNARKLMQEIEEREAELTRGLQSQLKQQFLERESRRVA